MDKRRDRNKEMERNRKVIGEKDRQEEKYMGMMRVRKGRGGGGDRFQIT